MLDELTGMTSICLPVSSLRPGEEQTSGFHQQTSLRELIGASLRPIIIPCTIRLGMASVTLGDLAQLVEGDVIYLNNAPSVPMQFLVADRPKFACRPLAVGTQLAVEIIEE
jgi:flagellar motor switch protein FliM